MFDLIHYFRYKYKKVRIVLMGLCDSKPPIEKKKVSIKVDDVPEPGIIIEDAS